MAGGLLNKHYLRWRMFTEELISSDPRYDFRIAVRNSAMGGASGQEGFVPFSVGLGSPKYFSDRGRLPSSPGVSPWS